ncbi:hypothetical protein FLA4_01550 [Candidatus Rickettsia kotlanii]|nr:hypothetical protein FLA4_01550 [Candidatus Rickettsia kotlanii]BDU60987.1 hypothetical protein HM2_01550 [Candidatus Rickettsia kotlanii]
MTSSRRDINFTAKNLIHKYYEKNILVIIMLLISRSIFAQSQISNLVVLVSYFINHVSQLEKLKENLNKYKQSSVVGVSGMGKTQLARMYAEIKITIT